jgi:cytochrome c oxidase subunit III
MIDDGWSLFRNLAGSAALFGAAFFSITGRRLLHVMSGVVIIAVITIRDNCGRSNSGDVETISLYWHFVDIVWMFVFPLMYLMNAR